MLRDVMGSDQIFQGSASMKNLYLLINLCSVIVPFLFSFHPKLRFDKQWKYFFPALLIASSAFILWDMYFTDQGVWGFNERYVTGIKIANLPLEEVLFFICIPYACLFTHHCLNLFFNFQWETKLTRLVTLLLAITLLTLGVLFNAQAYTSVTFIALGILLLVYQYIWKGKSLSHMYSSWFFLLIPFLIVNGILTGTGLEEPVVWYNNAENFSIRILTIPIEDVFYGFLLFLLTVTFIEIFQPKSNR